MFKLPKLLGSALLAVSLFASAGLALAGPTYHVTLDTSAYSGSNGNIDFNLLAVDGATAATAVVSNFSGLPNAVSTRSGAVSGNLPGAVTFMNTSGFNDLFQSVVFQNAISFDVSFMGDFLTNAGVDGSIFAVALFNEAGDAYLGANGGNQVEFALTPASGNAAGSVTFTLLEAGAGATLVSAAVPEPTALMLLLTGFGLMGVMVKRRQA